MRIVPRIKIKIGMRTIKTALAVTIAISISYLLNLNSPFFAAIAAIITLQGNIVDSFRMGRDRILGTIIGAVIGLASSYVALGNPIVIGLGIIVLIYISNLIHFNKTITISSVVFISIMLNPNGGSILLYSLFRVLDTFVGISVAVIVNLIISPPFSRDIVTGTCKEIVEKCHIAMKLMVLKENMPLEEIGDELAILEREYPTYKREEESHLVKEGKVDLHEARKLINKLYHNIYLLDEMGKECRISSENVTALNKMYEIEILPSEDLTNEEIVYNYHLNQSLEILKKLSHALDL